MIHEENTQNYYYYFLSKPEGRLTQCRSYVLAFFKLCDNAVNVQQTSCWIVYSMSSEGDTRTDHLHPQKQQPLIIKVNVPYSHNYREYGNRQIRQNVELRL